MILGGKLHKTVITKGVQVLKVDYTSHKSTWRDMKVNSISKNALFDMRKLLNIGMFGSIVEYCRLEILR